MRKSLSGKTPGLSGDKGPDRKKIKNIILGTVLGVIVLLVVAIAALTILNPGSSPAATPTPTPKPSVTPVPSVTPSPTPAPTATPTPIPSGWVYSNTDQLQLSGLLKADSGILIMGITITPGSAPVNVSNLTVNIVCDGKTYDRVYTFGKKDWGELFDGTYMLRVGVDLSVKIDTIAAGIPQGRPMTVKITRNSDPYGQFTLAPT
jgi:hypothetical protein